ncbi:enoyl-CoA hydratase/isomerase [Alcanivorax balearicus MACL04]|uniref:Enoyl-CoA hydratase/isomerase n=1 Tax=Alloalcanivorax balearicus MACL04 TaxID=1177182 RepID=A0ABT2QT92_9GAMM|nr:crotonase/enoyl-CoA hydratase family protein [Alloalcanivorax balearicus]MCU5780753.1 enoyl-CoA hydratase/isomerase [Alloalcanivorax balearicus MACL04]
MNDVIRVIETETPGVVEVRLNRPDKHNALNSELFAALAGMAERLSAWQGLRAVVLSGEGKSFCAGLDMENFSRMAQGSGAGVGGRKTLAERTHGDSNQAQYAAMVWRDVPVPVIAAVHGVAFGGGLQVALGADLRLARADSRWSVMEIQWGLVPDMAGMVLISELVRPDRVRELCYSGRIFDGEEAADLGLVTRVCESPREEALAMARDIAGRNPHAVRAMKRLLNQSAMPQEQAARVLLAESVEQDAIIGQPNQVEAVYARMEKRAPVFRDPEH